MIYYSIYLNNVRISIILNFGKLIRIKLNLVGVRSNYEELEGVKRKEKEVKKRS